MTTYGLDLRPVALKPLALPAEHGGWCFLVEPVALGLLVAPSWSGALTAVAATFAFLMRHPLRLAWQDARRGRVFARSPYCWTFAALFGIAATVALGGALVTTGAEFLIPLALAIPFGATQLLFDVANRGRDLIAEMSGAAAASSIVAAIAVAGGMSLVPALGLSGIMLTRALPAILYVRTMLRRAPRWPVLAVHGAACVLAALLWSPLVLAGMGILLLRAIAGFTHDPPPAKTIGMQELGFGALVVALAAA